MIALDRCFLQMWSLTGGLLIPMAVILMVNVVIFILATRRLFLSANLASRVKQVKSERRAAIERIRNTVGILFLLGLTWIVGFFQLIVASHQVKLASAAPFKFQDRGEIEEKEKA